MEQIHIITPTTRLYNLPAIYKSLRSVSPYFKTDWWIVLDFANIEQTDIQTLPDFFVSRYMNDYQIAPHVIGVSNHEFVAGKGQINAALDLIEKGWIYVVDDDTIVHPDFGKWFHMLRNTMIMPQAFLFAQEHKNGFVRSVHPSTVRETHIDQGQYILYRDLIGDERYLQKYTGDGEFIERLYNKIEEEQRLTTFMFVNQPLAYYNWLRYV